MHECILVRREKQYLFLPIEGSVHQGVSLLHCPLLALPFPVFHRWIPRNPAVGEGGRNPVLVGEVGTSTSQTNTGKDGES